MKQRYRRVCVAAAALIVTVAANAIAEAPPRVYGVLRYPAAGNIQLDEGTIEMWLLCGFDSTAAGFTGSALFELQFPDSNFHYTTFYLGWGKAIAQVGYGPIQHSYVWSRSLAWKPGEFHHIAWTWSGRKRCVYIDGVAGGRGGRSEVPKEMIVEGPLVGNLTRGVLRIGNQTSVTVDEVRISSVARTPAEIAETWNKSPQPDAFTMLLDHCDSGDAMEGGFKVVDGRFGKAIQLWKD